MKQLIIIPLFFISVCTYSQLFSAYNFKFKTYTTQEGLVHNFTLKCRMDSKGFLWIITQNGLSRFDGYQFKNFQNILNDTTSLPFNELTDIAVDASDRVWLAYGNGLCYYDQAKHSFFKLKQKALSLCFDGTNNKIWFNNAAGLFEVNLKTLQAKPSSLQVRYSNKPLFTNIDSKQRVWINIERGGYYIYNIPTASYQYYNYENWPRNMFEDNEGNNWITTWQSGLQLFDEKTGANTNAVFHLPTANASDFIYQDATQSIPVTGTDIIWVAMHTNGIALFSKKERRFVQLLQYDPAAKSGIASDFNSSIYTDKKGVIWICTWKGLTKLNPQEQQFQSEELKFLQSPMYNLVSSIIDDPYKKEDAWIGVNGSGVCHYDKVKNRPVKWYFRSEENADAVANYDWRWITTGLKDRLNNIWFSTNGGLVKVDHGNVSTIKIEFDKKPTLPNNVQLLPDGSLWLSTKFGIISFNTTTGQYQVFRNDMAGKTVEKYYDVNEISNNLLLCAAEKGLMLFNRIDGSFRKINLPQTDTLKNEWVTFYALVQIGQKVYAASASGLMEYDLQSGKSIVLGKEQEIFKLQPHSLFKDHKDHLWIYTLHGLFRYSPTKREFKKFTTADGVYDNSSDPVQMFDYNNDIYVGYRMAYTRFNPLLVDINSNMARPLITTVSINNTLSKIDPDSFVTQPLQLSYRENNLHFDFTAIDYTNSEKISFAYILEGFDRGWIYAGNNRKVTYANLKGGNYILKLKACNSSGIWNEKYTSFNFHIQVPFWKSWWFWPLMAMLFVTAVLLVAAKRVAIIRRKEQEKTAVNKMMAELETKLLRSQMNPHFIFNSLNSIQKYIWENKEEDAAEYLARFAKLIRAILENSRKETVSLKEEIETMKLYIELEHRRSNAHFDYSIKVDETLDQYDISIPPLLLQPFIENAIWHGLNKKESKGNLYVTIQRQDEQLTCTVDDDGAGRQEKPTAVAADKKSLGIEITQQRINRLIETSKQTASISIHDKKENGMSTGTTVTIILPLQKNTEC